MFDVLVCTSFIIFGFGVGIFVGKWIVEWMDKE